MGQGSEGRLGTTEASRVHPEAPFLRFTSVWSALWHRLGKSVASVSRQHHTNSQTLRPEINHRIIGIQSRVKYQTGDTRTLFWIQFWVTKNEKEKITGRTEKVDISGGWGEGGDGGGREEGLYRRLFFFFFSYFFLLSWREWVRQMAKKNVGIELVSYTVPSLWFPSHFPSLQLCLYHHHHNHPLCLLPIPLLMFMVWHY